MYRWLKTRVGRRAADLLTALWYSLVILGIFYCAFEPQAELKYLTL